MSPAGTPDKPADGQQRPRQSSGVPLQGSGYTPWQLLGGEEDEPADEEQRPSRYRTRPHHWLLTVTGVALVILAAWQLGGTAR